MSIPGFNNEKCRQSNRIAAARYGTEAIPLRFLAGSPAEYGDGFSPLKTSGKMPATPDEALKLINSKLPEGSDKLSLDEIYIHYFEAANTNYIADRSGFLAESTLKNIAKGGGDGVSFMNSHRTGGLSDPAELSFGQTFCGQYQEGFDSDGTAARRALLGVYMVRGLHPAGSNGPSTDDLDRMLRTGTAKDVSVGLRGGYRTCDVCGNRIGYDDDAFDEKGRRKCQHATGTKYNMTEKEVADQKARSSLNTTGVASYTLHDSVLGELSAVYDGAVPGAGIRQVLSVMKQDELSPESMRAFLTEAYNYYGDLLPFELGKIVEIKPEEPAPSAPNTQSEESIMTIFEQALVNMGWKAPSENSSPQTAAATAPPVPPIPPAVATQLAPDQPEKTPREIELETRLAARDNEDAKNLAIQRAAAAKAFVSEVRPNIVPAIEPQVHALYAAAQNFDAAPGAQKFKVEGRTEELTMCDLVRESFTGLGEHLSFKSPSPNATETEPGDVTPGGEGDNNSVSPGRKKELLNKTSLGRAVRPSA